MGYEKDIFGSLRMNSNSYINHGESRVYHPQLVAVYHQCEALYIIKPQERYSPKGADEIQGRFAALDDMHRTSRGDDIPSLRLG